MKIVRSPRKKSKSLSFTSSSTSSRFDCFLSEREDGSFPIKQEDLQPSTNHSKKKKTLWSQVKLLKCASPLFLNSSSRKLEESHHCYEPTNDDDDDDDRLLFMDNFPGGNVVECAGELDDTGHAPTWAANLSFEEISFDNTSQLNFTQETIDTTVLEEDTSLDRIGIGPIVPELSLSSLAAQSVLANAADHHFANSSAVYLEEEEDRASSVLENMLRDCLSQESTQHDRTDGPAEEEPRLVESSSTDDTHPESPPKQEPSPSLASLSSCPSNPVAVQTTMGPPGDTKPPVQPKSSSRSGNETMAAITHTSNFLTPPRPLVRGRQIHDEATFNTPTKPADDTKNPATRALPNSTTDARDPTNISNNRTWSFSSFSTSPFRETFHKPPHHKPTSSFFWRSHPGMTVTSYSPQPRRRRQTPLKDITPQLIVTTSSLSPSNSSLVIDEAQDEEPSREDAAAEPPRRQHVRFVDNDEWVDFPTNSSFSSAWTTA